MANFGWAYVDCAESSGGGGSALAQAIEGATGSVLFLTGAGAASGSTHLMFYTASTHGNPPHTLVLSGNMVITGTLSASVINYEDIAVIDATGSTYFGNSVDDMHLRTGSFELRNGSGDMIMSASAYSKVVRFYGATRFAVRNVAGTSPTVTNADYIIAIANANPVTVSLPSASAGATTGHTGEGTTFVIKDTVTSRVGAANNITLTGTAGSDVLIDGDGTYVLTGTMPAISLFSNGTSWFVF